MLKVKSKIKSTSDENKKRLLAVGLFEVNHMLKPINGCLLNANQNIKFFFL